jgi:hypothetical protein
MRKGRAPSNLRRKVRRRADDRCEYCFFPHALSSGPFHCDHLTPQAQGGLTAFNNLVWACAWCNGFKGDRTTAEDRTTGAIVPLFNPRTDRWTDHFCWSKDLLSVRGLSPTGRATITLLRLNRRGSKYMRSAWIRAGIHPGLPRGAKLPE